MGQPLGWGTSGWCVVKEHIHFKVFIIHIISPSHNHGTVKNCVPPIIVTFRAIFHWTMIMGERVRTLPNRKKIGNLVEFEGSNPNEKDYISGFRLVNSCIWPRFVIGIPRLQFMFEPVNCNNCTNKYCVQHTVYTQISINIYIYTFIFVVVLYMNIYIYIFIYITCWIPTNNSQPQLCVFIFIFFGSIPVSLSIPSWGLKGKTKPRESKNPQRCCVCVCVCVCEF